MKKEDHKAILDKIKNASNDADRMSLLIELEKDYSTVLSERDIAVTEKDNAVCERDKYAKLNNELWLANSAQQNAGEATNNDDKKTTDEPPQKRTYEDLESKF